MLVYRSGDESNQPHVLELTISGRQVLSDIPMHSEWAPPVKLGLAQRIFSGLLLSEDIVAVFTQGSVVLIILSSVADGGAKDRAFEFARSIFKAAV